MNRKNESAAVKLATPHQIAQAQRLANQCGHLALRCGSAFECSRCGLDGGVRADGSTVGDIFTTACTGAS